ncbi:MAG: hypothetical protein PHE79_00585 [Eubacteriales bacterium]|nr:hypothetical protein [Eubacteriales bacterium]
MKSFPDILGTELQNAAALLEAEGLDFIVAETKPPKRELTEGTLRVIRVQLQNTETDKSELREKLDMPTSNRAVLTVCRI